MDSVARVRQSARVCKRSPRDGSVSAKDAQWFSPEAPLPAECWQHDREDGNRSKDEYSGIGAVLGRTTCCLQYAFNDGDVRCLSTRLETRTKESIARASLKVLNLGSEAKALPGMHAPATNFSIEERLSESTRASTRKMVNYACGE